KHGGSLSYFLFIIFIETISVISFVFYPFSLVLIKFLPLVVKQHDRILVNLLLCFIGGSVCGTSVDFHTIDVECLIKIWSIDQKPMQGLGGVCIFLSLKVVVVSSIISPSNIFSLSIRRPLPVVLGLR